jgi:hypothetical protein
MQKPGITALRGCFGHMESRLCRLAMIDQLLHTKMFQILAKERIEPL